MRGSPEVLLSASGIAHSFPCRRGMAAEQEDASRPCGGWTWNWSEGECLALVGESGSGKTTLARTLLRLVEPGEGEVASTGRMS